MLVAAWDIETYSLPTDQLSVSLQRRLDWESAYHQRDPDLPGADDTTPLRTARLDCPHTRRRERTACGFLDADRLSPCAT